MYIKVSKVVLYLHLYWLQFHMLHSCYVRTSFVT